MGRKRTYSEGITEIKAWQSQAVQGVLSCQADIDLFPNI